jgi:hypothetical protein
MKPLDKNYLTLQFRDKIHSMNGTRFQIFFEDIMEKAFPNFQRIKPNGNEGDGGNDGYIRDLGIYFQVYSPNVPSIKQAKAAEKLLDDFEKLKANWEDICKIKEYRFVFNDKFDGSTQNIESAISRLSRSNKGTKFCTFLAKNLEDTFFSLKESDFLRLGFDIESRKAVSIAHEYLQKVEIELSRENAKYASRSLENVEGIIGSLQDERLGAFLS